MSDVSGELGDIVEMSNLTWSVLFGISGECKHERFVTGKYIELPTFDEVEEVLNGELHCQEFSIKCAVLDSRKTELSREVGNWHRARKQCDTG